MHIVMFYHSLISDWNHGNAHFLRGVVAELLERGHTVDLYEPRDAWSLQMLCEEHGDWPVRAFRRFFPHLRSNRYTLAQLDLDEVLQDADLVLVHEWNDHDLVRRIGHHRARHQHYRLLFHDTHHRSVSDPKAIARYNLSHYDGVLAFGETIRARYLENNWIERAWTWHEAADTRIFYPRPADEYEGDLVWIGNWGDDERDAELKEFLLEPINELGLDACFHGVRYPDHVRAALEDAGVQYQGWLANYLVPEAFARYRMTAHVPRRPYSRMLPGIPTIRPFEAMACRIPLVCSPWQDTEDLFTAGKDYLLARNGSEMKQHFRDLLHDDGLVSELTEQACQTIHERHTCAHRVDELLAICDTLDLPVNLPVAATGD